MGMQLNIKSDDAYAMASELATLTGESLTTAVTEAIRQRLERERAKAAKMRKILVLAAEIRAHIREPVSSDHSWLYDEDGLPK
jgi:antitoxin VapB